MENLQQICEKENMVIQD